MHEGRAIYDKRFEILDAIGLKPSMDIADIGAGGGLFSRLIAQRVGPDGADGTLVLIDFKRI